MALCYAKRNNLLIVRQQKSGISRSFLLFRQLFTQIFQCKLVLFERKSLQSTKCRIFELVKQWRKEDTMSQITSIIEELVTPIVEELELELVDVEFIKEGRDWFLRVYVDTRAGGIDILQCAQVSERLSEKLDENDPIEQNYYLEVSSPGAERPLKKQEDFENAIGKFIYVKTYEPIKDLKEFLGYLRAYTETYLEIEIRIKTRKLTVQIDKEKIAQARLAIDFSDKQI